jgi:polyhydroxyalkanoate synthesis regulator phasin
MVDGGWFMAARKRASTRSKLLKRAVKAGRSALREAERRVPPDVRKQIERTVQDGQKTLHTAIKQVQTRLDRTARQTDLDRAIKRLDELTKQIRKMAIGATASATARRPATRKPATRKPAARKPAASRAAPRRAPAKRASKRAVRTTARPETVPAPQPDPEPERPESF